jgi:hypothetical protein
MKHSADPGNRYLGMYSFDCSFVTSDDAIVVSKETGIGGFREAVLLWRDLLWCKWHRPRPLLPCFLPLKHTQWHSLAILICKLQFANASLSFPDFLKPWRDLNPCRRFLTRMRWPLRHCATAPRRPAAPPPGPPVGSMLCSIAHKLEPGQDSNPRFSVPRTGRLGPGWPC